MKVLEIFKYEDNLCIDTYGPQHPDKMFINQDEKEKNNTLVRLLSRTGYPGCLIYYSNYYYEFFVTED